MITRALVLSVILCVRLLMAIEVITDVAVVSKGHGSITFRWNVTVNTAPYTCYVAFGKTGALGSNTPYYSNVTSSGSATLMRTITVGGLEGGTEYFFTPYCNSGTGWSAYSCASDGVGWTCDGGLIKVTMDAVPAEHPVIPTLPTENVIDNEVVINGNTLTYGDSGCTTLQSCLTTCAGYDPNLNHKVTLPPGIYQAATGAVTITLPPKVGTGVCVVEPIASAYSKLPPSGHRITRADINNMVVIQGKVENLSETTLPMRYLVDATDTNGWRFNGVVFRWPNPTEAPQIREISNLTAGCTATLTTAHPWPIHTQLYMYGGVGYAGRGVNGVYRANAGTVVNGTTLTFAGLAGAAPNCNCAVPPCTVPKVLRVVGNTIASATNTNPVIVTTAEEHGLFNEKEWAISSITDGVLQLADGAHTLTGGTVWITGASTGNGGYRISTVVGNLVTLIGYPVGLCAANCGTVRYQRYVQVQGAKGLTAMNGGSMYTVLSPTQVRLENVVGNGSYAGGGVLAFDPDQYFAMINAYRTSSNIVFDRCIFDGIGYPNRIYTALILNAADSSVVNSAFYEISNWRSVNTVAMSYQSGYEGALGASIAVEYTHCRRCRIENNYIHAEGVSIFGQEFVAKGVPDNQFETQDIVVRRNTVTKPRNRMAGWSTSRGTYVTTRHHFEAKKVQRALITGNHFDGNWADWVPCGNAISLRGLGTNGTTSLDGTVRDVTISHNTIVNTASAIGIVGLDYYIGHYQYFASRVKIDNNLAHSIDRRQWASNPYGAAPGLCAYFVSIIGGYEDVIISNNTAIDNRGTFPQFLNWEGQRGEGYKIVNNVFMHNTDNGAGAIGGFYDTISNMLPAPNLATSWTRFTANTNVIANGNVVVPGVTNTNGDSKYDDPAVRISQGTCNTYFAGYPVGALNCTPSSTTANLTFLGLGFDDYVKRNYKWRGSNGYGVAGSKRSTDKRDVGVDFVRLRREQGRLSIAELRQRVGEVGILSYDAPLPVHCYYRIGVDGVWNADTSTVVGFRNTAIAAIGTEKVYLSCGTERYECNNRGGYCSLMNP